jgi:HlyD family secretion protein
MRLAAWGGVFIATLVMTGGAWLMFSERSCPPNAACASTTPEGETTPSRRPGVVAARGRLEPPDGFIHVAGPSDFAVVVGQVLVEENDFVHAGQELARIDTFVSRRAAVEMREAQLHQMRARGRRARLLYANGSLSEESRDADITAEAVAEASLETAQAELDLATARSPVEGQVLRIYAHQGERVGPEGIMTLARVREMRAIAEVYETDVQFVHLGEHAVVTSAAFSGPLAGTAVKIRPEVAKQALLATDPIARTDARVVEVEIKLDNPLAVQSLSNVQVDVTLEP